MDRFPFYRKKLHFKSTRQMVEKRDTLDETIKFS